MKLFVLGATGGVGRKIVEEAVRRGHDVRALVRSSLDVAGVERVDVVRADSVDDPRALAKLDGSDVVVSCLGLRRKNARNPFSALTSPPDLCASTMTKLVPAMKQRGIKRILVVSAAGVGESRPRVSLVFRAVIAVSKIGKSYDDLDAMERVLRASDLDWLAPRPVSLTNDDAKGNVVVVDRYRLTATITRADVAHYLLDRMTDAMPFVDRTPMIANDV